MMKIVKLIQALCNRLNHDFDKAFEKDRPGYKSHFMTHLIIASIISAIVWIIVEVWLFPDMMRHPFEVTHRQIWFVKKLYFLPCIIYWLVYTWSRISILKEPKAKFGYGLMTFAFFVMLGPYFSPIVFGLILLAIVVQIALLLLTIIVWVIDLCNAGSGNKKRFKLDNGDTVTEETGLFGEKSYTGASGKSYTTNDYGETFREKD